MKEIRKKRIESLLRDKISAMLIRGDVKDPRIRGLVTVTDVAVSGDLKDAKVYLSVMDEERKQQNVLAAFQHAAGHIQRLLARSITLKSTPRLTFHLDDSLARGYRISQTLKNLR
jgi:ribosome-binding factor A